MATLIPKLNKFFKTRGATKVTQEILEKFILPFARAWDPTASVDDAIGAFFAIEKRMIVKAKALKKFRMPGQHQRVGGPPTKRFGIRMVPEGTPMLIVLDAKDGTAKIDITLDGEYITFLLEKFEFEYLKDRLELYE